MYFNLIIYENATWQYIIDYVLNFTSIFLTSNLTSNFKDVKSFVCNSTSLKQTSKVKIPPKKKLSLKLEATLNFLV